MNQDLIKQLKKFREIEPDAEFLRKSRLTLLSYERQRKFSFGSYLAAWSVSFALVFIIVLGYVFLPVKSEQIPVASAETLHSELDNMNVNITLKEINYNTEVNQTIDNTLSEIVTNKASHLNAGILESEGSGLVNQNATTSQSSQINQLLNQVLK